MSYLSLVLPAQTKQEVLHILANQDVTRVTQTLLLSQRSNSNVMNWHIVCWAQGSQHWGLLHEASSWKATADASVSLE